MGIYRFSTEGHIEEDAWFLYEFSLFIENMWCNTIYRYNSILVCSIKLVYLVDYRED